MKQIVEYLINNHIKSDEIKLRNIASGMTFADLKDGYCFAEERPSPQHMKQIANVIRTIYVFNKKSNIGTERCNCYFTITELGWPNMHNKHIYLDVEHQTVDKFALEPCTDNEMKLLNTVALLINKSNYNITPLHGKHVGTINDKEFSISIFKEYQKYFD